MNPLLITILLRMIERIGDVIIGGLAIYYGYTLFLRLPDLKNSQGEIQWGDRSVILSRVGPGIFFALFGVTVTIVSLYSSVRYDSTVLAAIDIPITMTAALPPESGGFSGVGASSSGQAISPEDVSSIGDNIGLLNSFEGKLATGFSEKDQRDFRLALPRIKLAMMESVWDDTKWSDRALFRQKILDAEIDCANLQQELTAEFYCYGTQGGN